MQNFYFEFKGRDEIDRITGSKLNLVYVETLNDNFEPMN